MRSSPEPLLDRDRPGDACDGRVRYASPHGRTTGLRFVTYKQVLGGCFRFAGNSLALLELVEAAYGDLPSQTLPSGAVEFEIELCLLPQTAPVHVGEPPAPRIQSDPPGVRATIDACNYVTIDPVRRCARIVASEGMLRHAYHLRSELIEFAVFTLATRGIGLVPLHAACIGNRERGVLLLGDSGAGKSTLALHAFLSGQELLAEDAVFVQPDGMLATGVGNFLHVTESALRFLDDASRRWISGAPVIRRRSGVEKFEADLRLGPGKLATTPLQLTGVVLLSALPTDAAKCLLRPIGGDRIDSLVSAGQPHAATQPGWRRFLRGLSGLGLHELRRGSHPRDAVHAVQQLLD